MLRRLLNGIHFPLFFSVVALAAIGILFIYSASYRDPGNYEAKQVFWILAGFLQGCLLSGLVCAWAANPFLSMMTSWADCPRSGITRACADDVGAATKSVRELIK